MSHPKIRLLDVTIDNLTRVQAQDHVRRFLKEPRLHTIVTPGPEFLLEASANPPFQRVLQQADLSLPDGFGLHVGARLTGQRLDQRIPGADFVDDMMEIAATMKSRVYLLGGLPGSAVGAAKALLHKHPALLIVGAESGYRGPWKRLHERRMIEHIHRSRPDILLVAFGAPKQELWIERHRHSLHRIRIAMGIGRTLDYLAGHIKRPPRTVRRVGMEWLYTYLTANQFYQPQLRRQRVTNATFRFIVEVMKRHRRG